MGTATYLYTDGTVAYTSDNGTADDETIPTGMENPDSTSTLIGGDGNDTITGGSGSAYVPLTPEELAKSGLVKQADGTYTTPDKSMVFNPTTGTWTNALAGATDTTGGLGSILGQIRAATGMTNQQLLASGAGLGALLQGALQQSQDPVKQASDLYNQAHTQAHTPITIKNLDGTTRSFDPYGSISVAPMARTQVAYTGNPTGAGLNDKAGNPTQGFQNTGKVEPYDVAQLYQSNFGRTPDTAGLNYWNGVAGTTGMNTKDLGADMVAGANPADKAAYDKLHPVAHFADGGYVPMATGGATADEINKLYEQTFGRMADTPGLQYWQSTGLTPDQIAANLVPGAQTQDKAYLADTSKPLDWTQTYNPSLATSRANTTSVDLPGQTTGGDLIWDSSANRWVDPTAAIQASYVQNFARPADQAGVDYWANQAANLGLTPQTLNQDIIGGAVQQDASAYQDPDHNRSLANTWALGTPSTSDIASGKVYWDAPANTWRSKTVDDSQYVPPATSVQPVSTVTPISTPPATPAPVPVGGSSTVNPLPTVAPMNAQRNQIPFTGDFLHYGEGPEHLFYNTVNPLYSGPGSVWDPSATGANQKPTVSNEHLSYVPPTTGPTGSTITPTQSFNGSIASGQYNPGSQAWWDYNHQNATMPISNTGVSGNGSSTGGSWNVGDPSQPPVWVPEGNVIPMARGGSIQPSGLSALGAPRMQGHIQGPGTGQSDEIPAKLSNGEYVLDADSVAALGDGSTDAGAKALDTMRQNIRKHKRSAPINKIPPKAKPPMAYLKGGKA